MKEKYRREFNFDFILPTMNYVYYNMCLIGQNISLVCCVAVTWHIKHEIWPGKPTRPVSFWIMINNFTPDWYFNSMSAKFCIHWIKETWGNIGRFDILIGFEPDKRKYWNMTRLWVIQNRSPETMLLNIIILRYNTSILSDLDQLTYCQKRNLSWTTV